jgi:mannose-1-phosphate guanylyltransferase/mannose-6-phosphate isomerase
MEPTIKSKQISHIFPVILSGGSGKRLWPLSRRNYPKQFHSFFGEYSLFQQTLYRLEKLNSNKISINLSLIVTNEEHRFLALEQIHGSSNTPFEIIVEPSIKNTAPSLTLAAYRALELEEDPILVVLPSDHSIKNLINFASKLEDAIQIASFGEIVIFGIKPDRPETGFGYIKINNRSRSGDRYAILDFKEKPNIESAKSFLKDDLFFWNSGIFVLKASVWIKALKTFRPDMLSCLKYSWEQKVQDKLFIRPKESLFSEIKSESIDYAVIENCINSAIDVNISMIAVDMGWNDLGSWEKMWEFQPKDSKGNVTYGDVINLDTKNSFVYSSQRLVSTIGLDQIIVIETTDCILVANKNYSQEVKEIVSKLEKEKRKEFFDSPKNLRPWGFFDNLKEGHGFKVKLISLKPNSSISLQKHNHRAEHWIVVKGIAHIIFGDSEKILHENESTFIPKGEIHRLSNKQSFILEIIEIQTGNYLEENDIVRFEDDYERK